MSALSLYDNEDCSERRGGGTSDSEDGEVFEEDHGAVERKRTLWTKNHQVSDDAEGDVAKQVAERWYRRTTYLPDLKTIVIIPVNLPWTQFYYAAHADNLCSYRMFDNSLYRVPRLRRAHSSRGVANREREP